jgi:hypothetical protein
MDRIDPDFMRKAFASIAKSRPPPIMESYHFTAVPCRVEIVAVGVKGFCPACNRLAYIGMYPYSNRDEIVKAYIYHSDRYGCNPRRLRFELIKEVKMVREPR